MQFHVTEIGSQRKGRQHTPWIKGYRHPVIAGRYKFRRPDGKGGWRSLAGAEWESVWLPDLPKVTAEQWVDLLALDGLTNFPHLHPTITQLSPESAETCRRQIRQEAEAMSKLLQAGTQTGEALPPGHLSESWVEVPMARGACDGWRPCEFQPICYSPDPAATVAESGLYQIRPATVAAPRSVPPPLAVPASV